MAILFCFATQYLISATPITIWPLEIKFNYEPGNNNDALKILDGNHMEGMHYKDVPVPEWKYNDGNTISEKFAYIKAQPKCSIQVRFDSNCPDNMHLIIKLTATVDGIGSVCNYFISNYTKLNFVELILQPTIPNSVGKRSFTWHWEIYAMPTNVGMYCASTSYMDTSHEYYTLFSNPVEPNITPLTTILDYACDWASGKSDQNSICNDILNRGFNLHYTWERNCHELSSDFVHLVTSLGITASQHRWAAPAQNLGDMEWQITRQIDPVGSMPQAEYRFWFHQWAEAASAQRDPSTNTSFAGSWGNYEDYLYTYYDYVTSIYPPATARIQNQPGQPKESCEDYDITVRHAEYANDYIIQTWRGPDR